MIFLTGKHLSRRTFLRSTGASFALPLLDAMVFSRGRFAISMPGSPALVVPAGTEVAHVVEDCRG
jgi:hypothetical protein